ncbi:MAG: HlyD family efflux transporter periplasmic adaptor subunit, partial [Mycobacteriaceae bacterium]
AVVWSVLGTVQTTFQGAGVLLTQYGTLNSPAPQGGQVTAIFVVQGDAVTAGERLATLQTEDGRAVPVLALGSGHVVEVLGYPGDHLAAGSPVATIQPEDEELHCFVYVPVSGRQPIKVGMPVQVSVTTVPSERYGLLLGTVERVANFPATRAGVDALLNNPDITAIVVGGAPVIQVEVALRRSPTTPSGFAWTSGNGPPTVLSAGTLVNASVVTNVQHPISLLLPSDRSSG